MIESHRSSTDRQGGFTLIEVLVAMTLSGLILAAVSAALILVMRSPPKTVEHLGSSNSAFRTGSTFADDIASAAPEAGQLAVAREVLGCGRETSLVRIVTTAGTDIEIRSYNVVEQGRLERRVCRGATRDEALDARLTSARTVVTNLVADSPPTVACRATAGAALAPPAPEGDPQCRLVSMTVTTTGNLVFTVDGRRDSVQTPLTSPTPTVPRCTVGTGGDTWVDKERPDANNTGNRSMMQVKNPTNNRQLFAFLKFDLLTECEGALEPAYLPGGKTLTGATLQLTFLKKAGGSSDRRFHLTVLQAGGTMWHEDQLTWNQSGTCDMVPAFKFPCRPTTGPVDTDIFQEFTVPNANNSKVDVDVLGAVNRWYTGALLPNRGWVIDRNFQTGDGTGDDGGWWFGSRDNIDTSVHPKLILEWD